MVTDQGGASRPFCFNKQDLPVTLRRSTRAKRVWLTMHPGQGLTLTLPVTVSEREVPDILTRHREWICARLEAMAHKNEAPWHSCLPTSVDLRCSERVLQVRYHQEPPERITSDNQVIDIWTAPANQDKSIELLQHWLIRLGRSVLIPLGQNLAALHGIAVTRFGVRNQHTRWGSCSANGAISLNAKLMLLSHALAEHVILHELAHVAHRNHGPNYKAHLRRLDPRAEEHDQQLRAAWAALPAWTKIRS